MIRLFVLFFFVLLLKQSFAQQASPLSLTFEPATGGEIKQRGSIQLAVPVLRSEKNQILLSPQYRFLRVDDSFPFGEDKFAQTSLRLIWLHPLNEQWNLMWIVAPMIASTAGNFSSEAWTGLTAVRFNWQKNDRISYSFGLAYSPRFSGNLLAPVLGFHWNISEKTDFFGVLPQVLRLSWSARPGVKVGLSGGGNSYNSYIPNVENFRYVWLREQNAGAFASMKLFRHWWLSSDLGYSLNRKLYAYSQTNRSAWQIGTPLKSSKKEPDYMYSSKGLFLRISVMFELDERTNF